MTTFSQRCAETQASGGKAGSGLDVAYEEEPLTPPCNSTKSSSVVEPAKGEEDSSTRVRLVPSISTAPIGAAKQIKQKQTNSQVKEAFGGGPISADRGRSLDRISRPGETKKGRAASSGGVTWGHSVNNNAVKGRATPSCCNGGSRDSLYHPSQSLQKHLDNRANAPYSSTKLRWVLIGVAVATLMLIGIAVTTAMRPPRLSEPVSQLLRSISEAESNGVLVSAPLSVAVAMKQHLIKQQAQLQENLLRQQVLQQMKLYEEAARAGAAATFGVGSSFMASLTVDAANQYLQLRRAQQKQRAASKRLMELASRLEASAYMDLSSDLRGETENASSRNVNSDSGEDMEGQKVKSSLTDAPQSNVDPPSPSARRLSESMQHEDQPESTTHVDPQRMQRQEDQQHFETLQPEGGKLSKEGAGVTNQDPLHSHQSKEIANGDLAEANYAINTDAMKPADRDSIIEVSRMMAEAFEEKRIAWGELAEIFLRAEQRLQTLLLQLLLQQQEYLSQQQPGHKNLRQTASDSTPSSPPISHGIKGRQSAAAAGAAAAVVRAALRKAQDVSHTAEAQVQTERSLWLLQLNVASETLNQRAKTQVDPISGDLNGNITQAGENTGDGLPEEKSEASSAVLNDQEATDPSYNKFIDNKSSDRTGIVSWDILNVLFSGDITKHEYASEGPQNDLAIQRGPLQEAAEILAQAANALPPVTLSSLAALDQQAAELVSQYKIQRGERAVFHADLQTLTQLGQSQHLLPSFFGDLLVFADDGSY